MFILPLTGFFAATPEPCPADDGAHERSVEIVTWQALPEGAGVRWASATAVHQRSPQFSFAWAAVQLVPSPELGAGTKGAVFGLRWQLTPLLYSFAADPRTRAWRFFVVEPIVRHSGSIELFVSPEYLTIGEDFSDGLGGRVGIRSYFGLIQRGDYLSMSLASAYYDFGGQAGVAYEAGAYALFGIVGVALSYAPELEQARWLSTLRLRYF